MAGKKKTSTRPPSKVTDTGRIEKRNNAPKNSLNMAKKTETEREIITRCGLSEPNSGGKTNATSPSAPTANTRGVGVHTPQRIAWSDISWTKIGELATQRRKQEDAKWRRRNSLDHLVSSVYADIEAAVQIQQHRAGVAGEPLSAEENARCERNEEIYFDRLRELRLLWTVRHPRHRTRFKRVCFPRGKKFDPIRVARDIVSEFPQRQTSLLQNLVDKLGWTLVTICLHSEEFCTRVLENTDTPDLDKRIRAILNHREELEFFARSRLFTWFDRTPEHHQQDVVIRDIKLIIAGEAISASDMTVEEEVNMERFDAPSQIIGFPDDDRGVKHPHEWKLSADGKRALRLDFVPGPEFATQTAIPQVNIDECDDLVQEYEWKSRAKWPRGVGPRFRSNQDFCEACHCEGVGEGREWKPDCECDVDNLKQVLATQGRYVGDRVQLREINPIIGTGVTALQRFPARSLLTEYVGEVYPLDAGIGGRYDNSKYILYQPQQGRLENDTNVDDMYIDPSVKGNWTRYMNHSCRPNVYFTSASCGNKALTCVTLGERAIEFGEELKVDYGKDYFTGQGLACLCGEDTCLLWNADKVQNNTIRLGAAKKKGIAPEWAK